MSFSCSKSTQSPIVLRTNSIFISASMSFLHSPSNCVFCALCRASFRCLGWNNEMNRWDPCAVGACILARGGVVQNKHTTSLTYSFLEGDEHYEKRKRSTQWRCVVVSCLFNQAPNCLSPANRPAQALTTKALPQDLCTCSSVSCSFCICPVCSPLQSVLCSDAISSEKTFSLSTSKVPPPAPSIPFPRSVFLHDTLHHYIWFVLVYLFVVSLPAPKQKHHEVRDFVQIFHFAVVTTQYLVVSRFWAAPAAGGRGRNWCD